MTKSRAQVEHADFSWNHSSVIARERSDEAIQTEAHAAFVWIASLPLAMTVKRFQQEAMRSSTPAARKASR
jgi:hypothetical protein